jgi:hypothetical protein
VNLAYRACGDSTALETAGVDPFPDGDIRLSSRLEVAFFGVFAVIAIEDVLDSDGSVSI